MLRISKPLAAGQAILYHQKEFSNAADNYYSEGDQIVGQWHGRLAAQKWGLVGPVAEGHFRRLAQGTDPHTGEALLRAVRPAPYRNARGETVQPMPHRAGWDAVFSAPKSVSIVALVGGDDRVREAHRASVALALDTLEGYAQARLGGDRPPVTTRAWAAATFEHDSARPVDGYPAPQLHTHAVIFNLTETDKVRAVQPRQLYRTQQFATAVYRADLALRLQALGYTVTRGAFGQPEIAGFSAAYLEASSPRRRQIQEWLLVHGGRASEVAALATRANKQETLDKATVQAQHRALAAAHGHQPQQVIQQAVLRDPDSMPAGGAREAIDYAKARGMERTAVVEDRAVLCDALTYGMGHTDLRAVTVEFGRRVDRGEFLDRPRVSSSPARSYTTPEMVALEQATLKRLWAGQGAHPPLAQPEIVVDVLQRHAYLNDPQKIAITRVLGLPDQVIAVNGAAGAGKTVSIAAVRDAAEQSGYTVHGLAPTSRAAAHLTTAGLQTETLQRFLRQPAATPGPTLYVLDEASLASTRLMRDFLDRTTAADRILLVGDIRQHQSVDAGKSFEQLQEAGMHGARLVQVVRQPDPALRAVVTQLARGEVRPAIAALQARGAVVEIPDRVERLRALARDFLASGPGTLVVAPDNESRGTINAVIHAALQDARRVAPDPAPTRVLVPKPEMTGIDRLYADRYDVGDVLRYTRGSAAWSLPGGSYATVRQTDRATNTITVERPDGTGVTYPVTRVAGVTVHREETRALAVGDRVQFTAPARALGIANRDLGTLHALTPTRALVVLDTGRTVDVVLAEHPHLDYGYAVTSYSSQGLTADRVLVHVDSERSAEAVVNQRLAYVALSRGRDAMRLYTDSVPMAIHHLSRDVSHRAAIERPSHQRAVTRESAVA